MQGLTHTNFLKIPRHEYPVKIRQPSNGWRRRLKVYFDFVPKFRAWPNPTYRNKSPVLASIVMSILLP